MIVRILIWRLFDSKTTIAELEESLRELEPPSTWISSDANEWFPDVYEEFDVFDV